MNRARVLNILGRLAMGLPLIAVSLVIRLDPPWTTWPAAEVGEPAYLWARGYVLFANVAGIALILIPGRRIRGIVACLTPVILGAFWLMAILAWPGGNDGGGMYWLVMVGAATVILGVIGVVGGILLLVLGARQHVGVLLK